MIKRINRKRRINKNRDGIAVTECALCVPLIIMFTLFSIEVCSVLFLKETITLAAYEGSRIGIQRGGTDANARTRITQLLDERGVTYKDDAVVEFSDPSFSIDPLDHFDYLPSSFPWKSKSPNCIENVVQQWRLCGRKVRHSNGFCNTFAAQNRYDLPFHHFVILFGMGPHSPSCGAEGAQPPSDFAEERMRETPLLAQLDGREVWALLLTE